MNGKEGLKSVNKATAGVGALLLLLVLNLALGNPLFNLFFGAAVRAGTRPTPPPAIAPGKDKTSKDKTGKASPQGASRSAADPAPKAKDEFALYDPSLKLEELKDLVSRPVPKLDRNPFEWEPTPQELKPNPTPTPPPPPPAPPPIMLKVVGYSEKPGGIKEAYICETGADKECSPDKEVYVVHEGEEFGNRYKTIKITPQQIDVEDQTGHQTGQLMVPQ
jgi:hypothetical protein